MQGRIIPEQLDKYQIFPSSDWQKELVESKEIGFDHIELLFDKELVFENLLSISDNLDIIGIKCEKNNRAQNVYSICMDYSSSISLMNNRDELIFYEKLIKLIKLINNSTIKVIIIPFFDKNSIKTVNDFKLVLNWIDKNKLDEIALKYNIKIALELNLPAYQIWATMSKYQFNNIRVCYDLGNAKAMGYCPEEEILILNKFIAHVHIKDRKINGPNVMLGEGDVNFKACFESLIQIGYGGLITLETPYCKSPALEAFNNLEFTKNIWVGVQS